MKVAEVLSDLVSLQACVCDYTAAMNLVAGSTNSTTNSAESKSQVQSAAKGKAEPALSRSLSGLADEDVSTSPDLQRALNLVDLHYGVKLKYMKEGGNASLEHARREVARVTSEI